VNPTMVEAAKRRGGHEGGVGARRGPGGGRGGTGMDPAVVGEAPAWIRRRWRCEGGRGVGARVATK
jgi:hypothetical protein